MGHINGLHIIFMAGTLVIIWVFFASCVLRRHRAEDQERQAKEKAEFEAVCQRHVQYIESECQMYFTHVRPGNGVHFYLFIVADEPAVSATDRERAVSVDMWASIHLDQTTKTADICCRPVYGSKDDPFGPFQEAVRVAEILASKGFRAVPCETGSRPPDRHFNKPFHADVVMTDPA